MASPLPPFRMILVQEKIHLVDSLSCFVARFDTVASCFHWIQKNHPGAEMDTDNNDYPKHRSVFADYGSKY